MFSKLFLLFAIMPIVEIALLLNVGEIIGGWNTVAIVIITAFAGATLVRQQGLNTFVQAQQKLNQGQLPSQELAEGLLLLVAGVLLVTPGFITDGVGFLFTLPITRPVIAKWLVHNFQGKIVTVHHQSYSNTPFTDSKLHPDEENIIEGEFQQKPDQNIDHKGP